MEIYKGHYIKKNGEERDAEIFLIKEDSEHIAGIDLSKLDEKEKEEFISIVKEYEKKMDKFIKKAFRSFIKESFTKLNLHGIK